MRSLTIIAFLGGVGLFSACAVPEKRPDGLATTPAKASSEETHVAVASEEDLICRTVEVTGSRFKKRVCATGAEWDAQRQASEQTQQYLRKTIRTQGGS